MKITFQKVIIHRFKSFDDAEINLENRGFVLVSGVNNNPIDNALSNGSGKSSWGDAIMWALTGETTSGISRNLANNKFDGGMYVKLFFHIDNDQFIIIRSKDSKEYGTNLSILINGQDKSGKGIRDSEKLLAQYLPDLTVSLIGSCIILGQGLPQCFTNNTPSGRKEILEKLSKSDFMIEDIKSRLTKRKIELNGEIRKHKDEIIRLESSLQTRKLSRDDAENQLNKLGKIDELLEAIEDIKKEVSDVESALNITYSNLETENNTLDNLRLLSVRLKEDFNAKKQDILDRKNKETAEIVELKNTLLLQASKYQSEINRLKSIKDVCPTCGQKIPGVIKQDTTELEKEYASLNSKINTTIDNINNISAKYQEELSLANTDLDKELEDNREKQRIVQNTLSQLKSSESELRIKSNKLQNQLQELLQSKNSYEIQVANYRKIIDDFTDFEKDVNEKLLYNKEREEDFNNHLEIINKITTLTTRDFRGILLKNVIDYIDKKAKEYSQEVFSSNAISFELNGNNIDINYDNKPVENLSGGERQKVNLIIQFAIRDMLCQFMNFSSSMIILDEIFDNLDSIGVSNILNMITRKLNDIESIFIISHHSSELDIPYDDELLIEKDTNGISRVR